MEPENKRPDDDLELPTPPLTGRQSSKFNLSNDIKRMAAVSLIVSFVVFMGIGFLGGGAFLTKKDFETNMAGMTATVDAAKADMEKIKTDANAAIAKANSDVATAVQSVPTTVSTQVSAQINTSVGQINNQLTSLNTKVDSMDAIVEQTSTNMYVANKNIEALQALVESQNDIIVDLEDRVNNLEDGTTSSDSGSEIDVDGDLTATLQTQFFDYVVHPVSVGTSEVQTPIRLKIINNSDKDISDIRVTLVFQPQSYASINWTATYPKMVGGATTWTSYGYVSTGMYFVNGWGISVKAHKETTINLVLYTKVATALTTDYMWEPAVEIDDYEVD